jgi:hypothetical protein
MKTPDAVDYAIEDALANEFTADSMIDNEAIEDSRDELEELCKLWFSYGENVTIEIDTDAKTATVMKARK